MVGVDPLTTNPVPDDAAERIAAALRLLARRDDDRPVIPVKTDPSSSARNCSASPACRQRLTIPQAGGRIFSEG